jgi:uncharacterized OB-fold protein
MTDVAAYSPPADIDTNAVTEPYWAALREGALALQHCADCGRVRVPPTSHCPNCHSKRTEWPRLSGRGTLYTYTTAALAREPGAPVCVPALVCPDETPDTKVFANIVECTLEELSVGLPVELVRAEPGVEAARFRPIRAGAR